LTITKVNFRYSVTLAFNKIFLEPDVDVYEQNDGNTAVTDSSLARSATTPTSNLQATVVNSSPAPSSTSATVINSSPTVSVAATTSTPAQSSAGVASKSYATSKTRRDAAHERKKGMYVSI
jgi:hypothetical protein